MAYNSKTEKVKEFGDRLFEECVIRIIKLIKKDLMPQMAVF